MTFVRQALPVAARGAFTPAEVMGLYLAAAGHDAGHFRKNNAFLKNSGHELAATYPTSTLENFHAAAVLKLMRDPRCGVVGWSRLAQHGGGNGDGDGGAEGVCGGEAAKEFSSDGDGACAGAGALMDLVKELILATDMVRGVYACGSEPECERKLVRLVFTQRNPPLSH